MTRIMISGILTSIILAASITPSVNGEKFKCPAYTKLSEDSFLFPDPNQCDKYWTCLNGQSRRSLCPDGLVFHPDKEEGEDPCDLKHNVPDKCEGRSGLQRPKPGDAHCPRQNGVYASSIPGECDTYYSCLNGKSSPTKCAPGLHYSDSIGTCVWPRESGRDDCDAAAPKQGQRRTTKSTAGNGLGTTSKPIETLANGFRCPGGKLGLHKALPHPSDCRLYYVCLDGVTPQDAGCVSGKVFNPTTEQCDIPANVEGCEYYYNPALKKQKEEEKKQIASKLGADVSSNDFSQFLKLLKMSGVLNGDSEAAIKATLKNQNKRGPLRGKRPGIGGRRPGGRRPGGRRKPPRRRPTTPRPVYYDDYYYDYDYLYEDEPPITSGRGFQDSKAIKSNRNPSIISQQQDDLKNLVRAAPIKTTREEDKSLSGAPAPAPTTSSSSKSAISGKKSSLFAVPESRRFSSRFIPRVRPVGNLENIHPAGFLKPGTTVADNKPAVEPVSSPQKPVSETRAPIAVSAAKSEPEMALSGKEAEDLFNSLFPTIGEAGDAVASSRPVIPVISSSEPVAVSSTTTSTTSTTTTEKPVVEELPRKASIFSRPRNTFRFRQSKPIITTTSTESEVITVVTEKVMSETKEEVNVKPERTSLFSLRKRFRSKNSFNRKITEETPTKEVATTSRPRFDQVTRRNNRFSFVPTPIVPEDKTDTDDNQDDVENNINESSSINEIPNATPRSIKKFLPRKSFRALIQSKNRNQVSPFAPKPAVVPEEIPEVRTNPPPPPPPPTTTTTTTASTTTVTTTIAPTTTTARTIPTTTSTTTIVVPTTTTSLTPLNLIPTRSNNPFTFFQTLVSSSSEAPVPVPQTPPPPPLPTTTSPPPPPTFAPTRATNNVTPFTFFQSPFNSLFSQSQQSSSRAQLPPVEPAFLNIPAVRKTEPSPRTTTNPPVVLVQQADPFSSLRSRGQFSSSLSRVPTVLQETTASPVLQQTFSFGRPGPTSSSPEEDPHHQRMMTQRARVQIKNFLPKAENEGDAIEKLRAKIESFQNRNRARG